MMSMKRSKKSISSDREFRNSRSRFIKSNSSTSGEGRTKNKVRSVLKGGSSVLKIDRNRRGLTISRGGIEPGGQRKRNYKIKGGFKFSMSRTGRSGSRKGKIRRDGEMDGRNRSKLMSSTFNGGDSRENCMKIKMQSGDRAGGSFRG